MNYEAFLRLDDRQRRTFIEALPDTGELARLREALERLVADEPTIDGASVPVKRWYSEGWNRLARDVRAALTVQHTEEE